jgi:CHASE2 domain-containing sensor protein
LPKRFLVGEDEPMGLSREIKYEIKRISRKLKGPLFQVLVAFVFSILVLFFLGSSVGIKLEVALLRAFFQVRGAILPPEEVVIVAIDDLSYQHFDASTNYPLPRKYVASALETINQAGPKLVILDGKIPQERLVDPLADDRLEAAIKAGPYSIWDGVSSNDPSGREIRLASEERFRKAAKMELPMTLYASAGSVMYVSDPLRSDDTPLHKRLWLARPLEAFVGATLKAPRPLDLINFYGPPGTLQQLSLYKLVGEEAATSAKLLKDKVVLLGYQSLQFGKGNLGKDQFLTSASEQGMFGVEIHGTVIGNLLHGAWLHRLDFMNELSLLAVSAFLLSSAIMRSPRPRTLAIAALIWSSMVVLAYLCFSRYQLWIAGLMSLAAAILVVTVLSAIYFLLRSEAYRRYVERSFAFEHEREL